MEQTSHDLVPYNPMEAQANTQDDNSENCKAAGSIGAMISGAHQTIDFLLPIMRLETEDCKANRKTLEKVWDLLKNFRQRWINL